jgi:esterase/lipase
MKTIIVFISLFLFQNVFTQGIAPKDWGLKKFHIKDSQLGDINFYVTEKGIDQDKPLLFVVSGCSGLPIMLVVQCGEKSIHLGTVPPDQIKYFSDYYHVGFISKAGTPFCDTVCVNEINPMKNLEEYQPSEEYIQKCGMEWEVQASIRVIDTLCQMLHNSENKVIAMGFSEGGILVTKLAAEDDKITHLVSVISTGLNQFYSSIINRRMDAFTGNLTHQEAQAEVDSLFAVYKKIYDDPNNTEKWYYGHPYKRWGSFCNYIPLEQLVKLEIPIYYLNGSIDRNSPVLQADYIMLEFLRLGKTNLTYTVLPGVEHSLYEVLLENGEEKAISRRNEAFKMILDWIESN